MSETKRSMGQNDGRLQGFSNSENDRRARLEGAPAGFEDAWRTSAKFRLMIAAQRERGAGRIADLAPIPRRTGSARPLEKA